jgi:excisionase family DNA binding protein
MTTSVTTATAEPIEVVTIRDACVVTGVSRRTIYNWLKAGKVEYVRTAGGAVRIVRASLFRCQPTRAWDQHALAPAIGEAGDGSRG